EQQLGDVGRRGDDGQGRHPEDQIPLVVHEAVLLVQQRAELCCLLGCACYSHVLSLLENCVWRNRRPQSTADAAEASCTSLSFSMPKSRMIVSAQRAKMPADSQP